MRTTRLQRSLLGALAALATLAAAPGRGELQAQFQSTPTLFSGQATAVKGQVLGIPIVLIDTGTVAVEGGKQEAHLLCYPAEDGCVVGLPDLTNGALSLEVLNATVVAQGGDSRARASVADLSVNVPNLSIGATLVDARASAQCADGRASVSGESELVNLEINGTPFVVAGEVNQKVELPGGAVVVINEQVANANAGNGDVTVRALHITIPGVPGTNTDTDIIVAEAHAGIHCGQKFCPADKDFITGGGWFEDSSRKNFAVAGGFRNGAFWGHLLFIDHGTRIKVKGTEVTGYSAVPDTSTSSTVRRIQGRYELNGGPGGMYEVEVDDQGEPGREDSFALSLKGALTLTAAGILEGGNIQLHTCR